MSVLSQFFSGGSKLIPIEIFAVGGGGGGGGAGPSSSSSGGGGGGGLVIYKSSHYAVAGISYPISIGAGGAGGPTAVTLASNGGDTIFGGIVVAHGGGGGGTSGTSPLYAATPTNGFYNSINYNQGSLGGSVGPISPIATDSLFSTSYAPSVTESGFALRSLGGFSPPSLPGNPAGGGGGGAVSKGTPSSGTVPFYNGGNGGTGVWATFIGLTTSYAGGGGGAAPAPATGTAGVGVDGGGCGYGQWPPIGTTISTSAGVANRGGGGGAGSFGAATSNGANGGSGYLFIRYPTAFAAATVTGNAPVTAQPGYNVYGWTSGPGTITFS